MNEVSNKKKTKIRRPKTKVKSQKTNVNVRPWTLALGQQHKPVISAYIITKNEERNITRAVESVRWMDEVIVLDSGSSDSTRELAKKLGANVSMAEFTGFVSQKNSAMELCQGEWVFNLDADEEVTPELRTSIEKIISGYKDDSRIDSTLPYVYYVKRKTLYMGRWITHCGWYPEYRARLSKKGYARWKGEILHEELHPIHRKGGSRITPAGFLSGDLLHRPYINLGEHLMTIERYSELWAKREAEAGRTFSWLDLIIRPAARFFKMYVLRAGFLDGGPGCVACFMGGWYTFMKYARLYELSKTKVQRPKSKAEEPKT